MSIPGSNVRLLRRRLNLSGRALALAAGVNEGNLSKLENGKIRLSQDALTRIAEALGVSLGVLFAEPDAVEAAALDTRRIPVLTPAQLADWKGPDSIDMDDSQPSVPVDVKRCSRFAFALTVDDRANAPHLIEGDDLIFDMRKMPVLGNMVAAVDDERNVYIGRFRQLPGAENGDPQFGVIPFDSLYPAGFSATARGLRLCGTMSEWRRYKTIF